MKKIHEVPAGGFQELKIVTITKFFNFYFKKFIETKSWGAPLLGRNFQFNVIKSLMVTLQNFAENTKIVQFIFQFKQAKVFQNKTNYATFAKLKHCILT